MKYQRSEKEYSPSIFEKVFFLAEIFFAKFLYDKKTYILILISIVPLLTLGNYDISEISESTFVGLISSGRFSVLSFVILPLICLILGISAIAEEKENKTISQLLARPVKREEIVLTKWITIMVIGIVIVCIDALIIYLGLCIHIQDFSILLEHLDVLIGAWLYLGLWVAVYCTIFLFLGIILDKNPLGWGLVVAYFEAFFGQFIFGLAAGGNSAFSISNHLNHVAAEYFLSDYLTFSITDMDPFQSLLICFGIIVGFLALSMFSMKRKDFS
jgi:ABC-type transport system involved in multi-copper enzyme maturation permease subunit